MVRFAVIGTSRITEKFLRSAENCPDFSLEAVYSRTLERGRAFAQKYGARRVYDSLAGLAEDPQVDAVYIASPNASHYSQAMQMMEAGKHVLCEKALASNLPQAGDMFACAREHGVVLMEAMRSIHDPGFQKIRENLPKLGKIRRADFRFCQYSSRYDDFRAGKPQNIFDVNCSAGALMDIGVYCVHPLLGLFGTPDRILAAPVMLRGGIDGAGTILAEYEDKIAELVYSKITSTGLPSEIQGGKGRHDHLLHHQSRGCGDSVQRRKPGENPG